MFKESTSYHHTGGYDDQQHEDYEQNYRNTDDGHNIMNHNNHGGKFKFLLLNNKKFFVSILTLAIVICISLLIGFIIYNIVVSGRKIIGKDRIVMVISIDGFRPDYLDMFKENVGNLTRIVNEGVRAKSMRPIFPSKTFPNHYTIVTGLYGESHGIVSNSFYDPNFNAKFTMGSEESFNPRWWLGEPIWVTAEKQGLVSASFFWPGSDVEIQGIYPTYYKKYDGSIDYDTRVKTVFEWLDSDKPPQMVLTYFSAVDSAGHKYGPHESNELRKAVIQVDNSIGLILSELEKRKLMDVVDLIVVSDHGMAFTPESKIVRMTDILGRDIINGGGDDTIFSMNDGPFFDLYVNSAVVSTNKSKIVDDLFEELVKSIDGNLTFSNAIQGVFLKSNMPERFHFANSDRIPDITILAKSGFSILRNPSSTLYGNGNHGYDNESPDMGSLFIARGRHFKKGLLSEETVRNLDVYPLICKLLELTPAPNNGTVQNFVTFLSEDDN